MCLAGIAALASGAAPPATVELEEIGVEGTKERERQRVPDTSVGLLSEIIVRHEGIARFMVGIYLPLRPVGPPRTEFSFRRKSSARQPEKRALRSPDN